MDCLFANWDVIGSQDDNILIDKNDNPWRIDNAGSFGFRAIGQKKNEW